MYVQTFVQCRDVIVLLCFVVWSWLFTAHVARPSESNREVLGTVEEHVEADGLGRPTPRTPPSEQGRVAVACADPLSHQAGPMSRCGVHAGHSARSPRGSVQEGVGHPRMIVNKLWRVCR